MVRQSASLGGTIQWLVDYAYDAFDRMVSRAAFSGMISPRHAHVERVV
jgi:hypothetical protein